MEKVKIKDVKTGAVKEVKKSLAGDYVGTGKFEIYKAKETKDFKTSTFSKNNKER